MEWDTDIPKIVARLNQTIHKSTGKSPFSIARGRSGQFVELEWMGVKRESIQEVINWKEIENRIEASNQINRDRRGGKFRQFLVGEKVWRKIHSPRALRPRCEGPYEITRKLGDVSYEIQNPKTKEKKIFHLDNLLKASEKSNLVLLPNPRGR